LRNIQASFTTNPKHFWSFVKEKNNSNLIPSSMFYDELNFDNSQAISNAFDDYFSSVYVKSQPFNIQQFPKPLPKSTINVSSLYISLSEVFEGLSNMGLDVLDSTYGSDGLPPIILSKCCYVLASPLHILFNMFHTQGIFPHQWKSSFVLPIFKSGNRNLIKNYHPISKLSFLPKLFEKIIEPKLSCAFNRLIIDEQHGFRAYKSAYANLLVYVTNLYATVEKRGQVDAIYTDLSKAVD
jgi:sarcosine oxidase/L-pipecolate oxidase